MNRILIVQKFREFFGLPVKFNPCSISTDEIKKNVMLIFEELKEYEKFASENNTESTAKAIADLDVLIKGLILQHGLQHKWPRIFDEVINSNMTKLNLYGQPSFDKFGKLDKSGAHYKLPDINKILKDAKY